MRRVFQVRHPLRLQNERTHSIMVGILVVALLPELVLVVLVAVYLWSSDSGRRNRAWRLMNFLRPSCAHLFGSKSAESRAFFSGNSACTKQVGIGEKRIE